MPAGGNGGTLAPLPWANDDSAAIWKLVSLLEEPETHHKLFGKDPSKVKSTHSVCTTHLIHPESHSVPEYNRGFKIQGLQGYHEIHLA